MVYRKTGRKDIETTKRGGNRSQKIWLKEQVISRGTSGGGATQARRVEWILTSVWGGIENRKLA